MVSFVRDVTTSERSRTLARGPRISQWLIQGPWVLISAVVRDPVGVAYLHSNHSALTIHNLYELHVPKNIHITCRILNELMPKTYINYLLNPALTSYRIRINWPSMYYNSDFMRAIFCIASVMATDVFLNSVTRASGMI